MRVPFTSMRPPSSRSTAGARSVALLTLSWVILASGLVGSASAASLRSAGLTVTSADVKSRTLTTKVTATRRLALRFAVVRGGRTLATGSASVPKGTRTLKVRLSRKPTGRRLKLRVTARYRDRSGRRRSATGLIALPKRAPATPTANRAPTALALSAAAVAENAAPGTAVGVLAGTDPDTGDTLTYALVAGSGGADNLAFTVSGAILRTAVPLDFEAKSSYAVRVRVSDGRGGTFDRALTITITNVNEAPGALALSSSVVPENQAAGTVIGVLSATDPDAGDTRSYSLVVGTGDADNARVAIVGDELRTAGPFDAEATPSLGIRVRVSDAGGLSSERAFTVTVSDVNETAPAVLLSNDTVPENVAPGRLVGTLSAVDPDVGDTPVFSLVPGDGSADNATFAISGSELRAAAVLDFETKSSHAIRVRADDGRGGLIEQPFTITVLDGGDRPLIVTSAGAARYEEGGPDVAVDPDLTVSDAGGADLEGAVARVSAGFDAGDTLAVTLQPGITRDYSPGTGVLTLTGTASIAAYQATLRTVTFSSASPAPTLSKTIEFTASDATGPGAPATRDIAVTTAPKGPVAVADTFDAIGNTGLFVGTTRPAAEAGKLIAGSVLANDTDADTPQGVLVAEAVTAAPTTLGGTITIEPDGNFTYQPDDGDVGVTDTFTYHVCDTAPCGPGTPGRAAGTVSLPLTGQVWFVRNNAAAGGDGTSDGPFDTLAEAEAASSTGDTVYVFEGDTTTTGLGTGYVMQAGERLVGEHAGLSLDPDAGGPLASQTLHAGTPGAHPTISATNEDVVVLAADTTVQGITADPGGAGGGIAGSGGIGGVTLVDVNVLDDPSPSTGTQPGLELDGTTGTTSVSGLVVGTTGATGVRLNKPGSVVFATAGTTTISSANGKALEAAGVDFGSSSFDNVTSSNSPTSAIALTTVQGTLSLGTGLLTNATSADVAISGGGANVTYDGTIADDVGPLVSINGQTGGTKDFNGAISDGLAGTPGGGISLSSNAGATIRFDGGLTLATGPNPGLAATGGGTVVVTDPVGTPANTIATTTGTALTVANTTIGAGGLTFERISSDGAPSGIVLNATGATAGLAVTGAGGTCTLDAPDCSGGEIAGSTGDAISLTSTASPSLTRMHIHDAAGNGILASTVSSLALADSLLVGNSDDLATNDEANLRMQAMSGAIALTNVVARDAAVHNVYWTPSSGTATLAASNLTAGPNNVATGGSGLLVAPSGTATTTVDITGGAFPGNRGDSLRFAASGTATGTLSVSGGTQFTDANSGVNVSADESADVKFAVSGATFLRHASHAIQGIVNDTATAAAAVDGTIANNTIGNVSLDSGSRDANGISYDIEGAADVALAITGNTVQHTDTQGIFVQARRPASPASAGPMLDLTLRDNSVTSIDDNSAFPFTVQYGTQIEARNLSNLCLDIAGNTSTGIGGATHFRVRQRDSSTFRLERFTGSGTDDGAVAGFLAGANDPGSTASATHATTYTAVADGTCQNPAP